MKQPPAARSDTATGTGDDAGNEPATRTGTGASERTAELAAGPASEPAAAAGNEGAAGTAAGPAAKAAATGAAATGAAGHGPGVPRATGAPGTGTGTGTGFAAPGAGTRAATNAAAERAGGADGGSVIVTRGLTKRFRGGQLAVDGLDLTVPAGSVFGFLGPNGSGKTTTIRMLLGLIRPTSGTARVLGAAMPGAARRVLPQVGALIEGPALYGFLSGRDNLRRLDAADPDADPRTRDARIAAALERVGLAAAGSKKARAYSLGMKQRLGLAAALLRPRRLLVLDEPTNGLDPQGMREIRALVREVAEEGTTVFLSSHLLDEIEQVCTHAAVMARGRLVVQGPVAELAAGARGRLSVTTPDTADAVRVLKEYGVTNLVVTGGRVTGEPPAGSPPRPRNGTPGPDGTSGPDGPAEGPPGQAGAFDPADLNAALVRDGVRVRGFGLERASLEDAFVALTGEGFDVAG